MVSMDPLQFSQEEKFLGSNQTDILFLELEKKILELRLDFQLNFLWKIGDGASVSVWFDSWHPRGPLYKFFFR